MVIALYQMLYNMNMIVTSEYVLKEAESCIYMIFYGKKIHDSMNHVFMIFYVITSSS